MHEREKIKWAPFNSVINGKEVKKELNENNNKIRKPILSNEQIIELENIIKECFENQDNVIIYHYRDGKILQKVGKITNIDGVNKKIYIDNTPLYFYNIIKILVKNT